MTEHDKEDLEDLLIQILREFNFDNPWPTLEVMAETGWQDATVGVELGELLERAREMVIDYV